MVRVGKVPEAVGLVVGDLDRVVVRPLGGLSTRSEHRLSLVALHKPDATGGLCCVRTGLPAEVAEHRLISIPPRGKYWIRLTPEAASCPQAERRKCLSSSFCEQWYVSWLPSIAK